MSFYFGICCLIENFWILVFVFLFTLKFVGDGTKYYNCIQAVEFVTMQHDDELWEELIKQCLHKPEMVYSSNTTAQTYSLDKNRG